MISILISMATGWTARLLAIVVNLIGVPLALQSLGPTRFGIMLISLSMGAWVGVFNLGGGRVVANIIARFGSKAPDFVATIVANVTRAAIVYHTAVFILSSCLLLACVNLVNLGEDGSRHRVEFTATTIGMFFVMNLWFVLLVFEGVDAGRHLNYRLAIYQIVAYSAVLVLLYTVVNRSSSVFVVTLVLGGGFVVGNVMHAVDVWIRNRALFGFGGKAKPSLVRAVFGSSVNFTIIAIAVSTIYQFTTGIFGLIIGPDEIVENLGVLMRIVVSVVGLCIAVTHPMSNLIADMVSRRDLRAAIHAARLTGLGLLFGFAVAAVAFLIFGEQLVSIWLRAPTQYDPLFRAMASLLLFATALSTYATGVAIGFGRISAVARIHLVQGVAVLPLAGLVFLWRGQGGILMAINVVLVVGALACLAQVPEIRPSLGRFGADRLAQSHTHGGD